MDGRRGCPFNDQRPRVLGRLHKDSLQTLGPELACVVLDRDPWSYSYPVRMIAYAEKVTLVEQCPGHTGRKVGEIFFQERRENKGQCIKRECNHEAYGFNGTCFAPAGFKRRGR